VLIHLISTKNNFAELWLYFLEWLYMKVLQRAPDFPLLMGALLSNLLGFNFSIIGISAPIFCKWNPLILPKPLVFTVSALISYSQGHSYNVDYKDKWPRNSQPQGLFVKQTSCGHYLYRPQRPHVALPLCPSISYYLWEVVYHF
jgi:hypothetical protein